jgi:hypothetical protein
MEPPDLQLVFIAMFIVRRIKRVNQAEIDKEDQD